MAVTSPDNLVTPDDGDDYALVQDLAAMADSVQDAITEWKNYGIGTDAERVALTGSSNPPLKDGLRWYSTDTGDAWVYEGSTWVAETPTLKLARSTDLTGGVTSSYGAAVFETAPKELSIGWDVGSPSRVTISRTGLYLFEGVAVIGSTSTGYVSLRVDGTTYSKREFSAPNSAGAATVPLLDVIPLNAGSYVELMVKSDGSYPLYSSTRLEAALLARR